jgi:hypothetical protein
MLLNVIHAYKSNHNDKKLLIEETSLKHLRVLRIPPTKFKNSQFHPLTF